MDDVAGLLMTATRMLFCGSLWIAAIAKYWAWRLHGRRESVGMAMAAGGAAAQQTWWLCNEAFVLAGGCNNPHIIAPSSLCALSGFMLAGGALVTVPAMLITAIGVGMLMQPVMRDLYGGRASTISASVLVGLFAAGLAFGLTLKG